MRADDDQIAKSGRAMQRSMGSDFTVTAAYAGRRGRRRSQAVRWWSGNKRIANRHPIVEIFALAFALPCVSPRSEIMENVKGLKVAILVADGFEQVELVEPRRALDEAGARTSIVSPSAGHRVRGWKSTEWGDNFPIDIALDHARPEEFEALLLPGGVANPDKLRMQPKAVAFVKAFFDADKPVAAICHGPWTIIEAGAAHGRRIASWPSIKTDLRNAGAEWVDQEVVVDGNLVSSRKPDDIPAFNREMVKLFSEMRQHVRTA